MPIRMKYRINSSWLVLGRVVRRPLPVFPPSRATQEKWGPSPLYEYDPESGHVAEPITKGCRMMMIALETRVSGASEPKRDHPY